MGHALDKTKASSLYLLFMEAYNIYLSGLDAQQNLKSMDDWCAEQADARPQFQFCHIIPWHELADMIYVISIHEETLLLYVDALGWLMFTCETW